ncbi:DUF420 domain-containing protein [Deinococcus cellulosilyticus]|uniref:DUF420 domain-containing protein n=1 Tax=Deinococcus cellulosilyticus (strain DSM 18568 / NBRC 106333 / KACC 11606 / 5516J-15) TaxID=1223518 RepID=A0A511N6D1_DEIC1|nr:DUF420 domain-containing protein [Deinococcus cellulosilyticus]GEM48017.1 hypothetical protein DC3_36520 [Deinococcus cellulosilyticus NBRC 106333 = KACC 11606]
MGELVTQLSVVFIVLSGISLVFGVYFIRTDRRQEHMTAMLTACALAVVFLVLYLTKLALGAGMKYAGPPEYKNLYFFILISHSILAAANGPMAIMAVRNALIGKKLADGRLERSREKGPAKYFLKHRAWARWTVPVWIYVVVTGWIIYLVMHYYGVPNT